MGILADRVEETTNTTGTGTLTLAGAVSKYQTFAAAFSTGAKVEYVIESGTDWEVGLGTYTTSGTTLSRDIIRRSSNSGSAIIVAAGAKVWSDLGADNFTSSVQPFRNRIYNGAWRFDQVNEGAAYSVNVSGLQAMDGWTGSSTGAGVFSMTRVADPDNASLYALKVACTTADASIVATDNYYFYHAIEGYDVADLKAGKSDASKITISFDMKFDVTGVYGVSIGNAAGDYSYVGNVTQNVASTNESKVVTLTLDTAHTWGYTSGVGLYLRLCLAAGSNFQAAAGSWINANNFTTSAQCNFMSANTNIGYIKRIQLEKGIIATPFEEISFASDLVRTQRYAEKSYEQGTAAGTNTIAGSRLDLYSTVYAVAPGFLFKTTKRAAPVMTGYTSAGVLGKWTDTIAGDQTVTFSTPSQNAVYYTVLAVGTAGYQGQWYANARLA